MKKIPWLFLALITIVAALLMYIAFQKIQINELTKTSEKLVPPVEPTVTTTAIQQPTGTHMRKFSYDKLTFLYPDSWVLSDNTSNPNFFTNNQLSGFDHMIVLQKGEYYLFFGVDTHQTGAEAGGIFISDEDYQSYLKTHEEIHIQGKTYFLFKNHTSLQDWNKPGREAGIFALASISQFIPKKVNSNNEQKTYDGTNDYFHVNGNSYMIIKLSKTGAGEMETPVDIQNEIKLILESISW